MKTEKAITPRSLVVGTLFTIVFTVITVYFTNHYDMCVTTTQIVVLPYVLLILMMLVLNPICRLIRVARTFSIVEVMIIFIMGTVSLGLSTFGLTDQLVPIAGSLFYQEWNTSQSEWNRYVVPFLNESYFVSEPGIQSAADRYRRALEASLKNKTIYDTALTFKQAQAKLTAAEAALKQVEALQEDEQSKAIKLSAARPAVDNAREVSRQVETQWAVLCGRYQLGAVDDILKTYPALIDAGEQQVQQAKKALDELEAGAFAKVKIFRRGLPRGLRAYPGILPMPEDDFHSYGRRLKRTVQGRAALHELKQAREILDRKSDSMAMENTAVESVDRHLGAAVRALQPVAQTDAYEKRQAQASKEEEEATRHIVELDKRLKQVSGEKRKTGRESAALLEKQIAAVAGELEHWRTVQREAASNRGKMDRQLNMAQKVAEVAGRMAAIQTGLRGPISVPDVQARLADVMQAFPSIEGSLRQFVIGDVPWSHWAKPLFRWSLVVILTYIILMSLNTLIFRQWAYNEKLTYPLVELPKALVSEEGIPPVFRSPLFRMGVAVSGLVMGWNVFCKTNIVPGLQPFDLNNSWYPYVINTAFDGLKYSRCHVYFTMIALSFLIPKNISFSLWFFCVISLVELQLMVWTGRGVDAGSFKSDWWYLMHFSLAQGQGALLVFSSVVLYKCRKYILCAFIQSTSIDLEPDERKELKIASFLFVGCSLGLILLLWRDMGASLFHTLFFYLVILLITIGLVRAVTEGGLLTFQCWAGPFQFIRAVFGLDKLWTSTSLFAPLMLYYSILFLDIKTFIAPAMANSLKLRDDFKMRRGLFHLALILALVVAGVTGIMTAIMMCYTRGADTMNSWFYTTLPRHCMFDVVRSMTKDAPPASPSLSLWIGTGALAMAALLYCRQYIFWLPHPLGMAMLVSPIMATLWFSIFLGWLVNGMVTKFGNKETFQKAKGFFLGLMVGELTVVVISMIVSVILGVNATIDLDRN